MKGSKPRTLPKGVVINRSSYAGSFPFGKIFSGFERVEAVRSIFLDETERVIASLKVDVKARQGYLYVDDESGHIGVSLPYLKEGDALSIYLDVIHELVHIRQFMEGKELFDSKFSYLKRPTEIEAYAAAAKEAKRIGMEREEIIDYLRVEWVTEEEFQGLLKEIGIVGKAR